MACRLQELYCTVAGYAHTGISLVSFDGNRFFPSGLSDDNGLYVVIPWIVRSFGISVEHAIAVFFYGLVGVSFLLGALGLFFLAKSKVSFFIGLLWLGTFSLYSCWGMTDVYLIQSSLVVAVIPGTLFFLQKRKIDCYSFFVLFVVGLLSGYADVMRSHSSLSVTVFIVLSLFLLVETANIKKIMLLCCFVFGMLVPLVHMHVVLSQRDRFFEHKEELFPQKHVFWHTVCAGLGFLKNDFGFAWDDATIVKTIMSQYPDVNYPSVAYEHAACKQCFSIVYNHPHFVLQTLAAKCGIIFYYFLLFSNIGFLLAFFCRKEWKIDFVFFSSILVSSSFALISIPGRYYLLGMLAFAVLYGIISFDYCVCYWRGRR